jgi:hypothetical protein
VCPRHDDDVGIRVLRLNGQAFLHASGWVLLNPGRQVSVIVPAASPNNALVSAGLAPAPRRSLESRFAWTVLETAIGGIAAGAT